MRNHISLSKVHPFVVQMWAFETETIMPVAIRWDPFSFFPCWGVCEDSEILDLINVGVLINMALR